MNGPKPEGLNRSRQLDIFRPEQAASPVTVIGAGGIGSPTVIMLAQMGVADLTVLDDDVVEEHNRPSQHYRREDLGKPKVLALAEQAESYGGCVIKARRERYVGQPLSGVVIGAVDSMGSRQAIWEGVRYNPNVDLYIDGRMGGLVYHVIPVIPHDPDGVAWYEQRLFPQSEAAPERCTAKAIIYNTFGIGALICAMLREWWVTGDRPKERRGDYGSLTFL